MTDTGADQGLDSRLVWAARDCAYAAQAMAEEDLSCDSVAALLAVLSELDAVAAADETVRGRAAAALLTRAQAAGRGGLTDADTGTVVRARTTVRRRKVRHQCIEDSLDALADLPEHRVDPDTGEDRGRAAARLLLWQRCLSRSWRWAELAHLGLAGEDLCEQTTVEQVHIAGPDGAARTLTIDPA